MGQGPILPSALTLNRISACCDYYNMLFLQTSFLRRTTSYDIPIRHSSDDAPTLWPSKTNTSNEGKKKTIAQSLQDRQRQNYAYLSTLSVLDFVCEDCLAYTIIRLALVSAKSRLNAADTWTWTSLEL